MHNIFIDGRAGTTGLRIEERLAARPDITLLTLPDDLRKDTQARADLLNSADVSFLCLPDDAAREAVALTTNPNSVIIDASTAHRTTPGWAYGMPELGIKINKTTRRIANPGCHASGFAALAMPLIQAGLLQKSAQLTCISLTGYSGAGKEAIAKYEDSPRKRGDALSAPMQYALGQTHKHLPEMVKHTGLEYAPLFCPMIADYYAGMEVTIPLHGLAAGDALACYRDFYAGAAVIQIVEPTGGPLPANYMSGRDSMEISVEGNDERLLLIARFDNLGKGASGAAVQCMNLAIGANETEGLVL